MVYGIHIRKQLLEVNMNLYEISEQFEELARLAETEDIPQQEW